MVAMSRRVHGQIVDATATGRRQPSGQWDASHDYRTPAVMY